MHRGWAGENQGIGAHSDERTGPRCWWLSWVSGVVAVGLLVLWAWSPRDLPDHGTVQVTFLDVGQGDAALVETSDGRAMLIDGGGASESYDLGRVAVAPLLWDRGIRRLDVVVATHPQQDHIGGLAFVVDKFQIGEFWTNGVVREAAFFHRVEEALHRRHVMVRAVSDAEQEVVFGACHIRVMNPRRESRAGLVEASGKQLNNRSVVFRLECGGTVLLFTGDIEQEAEASLVRSGESLKASVLKVPHHGARGSVDESFLRAVHPQVAVVSVGAGNPYGHPAPDMLEAYSRLGIQVLRTDRNGAVMVVGADQGVRFSCESGRRLTRVRLESIGSGKMEGQNLRRLLLGTTSCST